MFKNFDYKHYAALAACVVIVGAFALIPSLHPYQAIGLSIAAPLFAYAGITLPQAGVGSKSLPESKDGGK
ncbi:MAG TPA: hypothetical protein VMI75_22755 [Polyangiaceae bacterium]|nr:hypothetical protein [Polyangiaceae bacterium]